MISTLRLNLLRFPYAIMAVGQTLVTWPGVISHPIAPVLGGAAAHSLLAGVGAISILGLRYPLKMLPILLFEILWKLIFLGFYALPLWRSGQMDADSWENIWPCFIVGIFFPLIPWRYVWANYVTQGGERWK